MKPVMLCRPDRVGDVVITTTCIPLIRQAFPGAEVHLLARPEMEPLFSGGGVVDEFIGLTDEKAERCLAHFCGAKPCAIFHFHPDEVIQAAAAEAGIPRRYGFYRESSGLGLTLALPYRKSEGKVHEAAYCMELVTAATGIREVPEWRYHLSPGEDARRSLLEKVSWLEESDEWILVINPTAARADLRWPPAYFRDVISAVSGPGRRVILIGHPAEDPGLEQCRFLLKKAGLEVVDLAGQLDLGETSHLLGYADYHLSRDTGTCHLAAAMGCPQTVVMGRGEAEFGKSRWQPLGERVTVFTPSVRRRFYETRRRFWQRSFRSVAPAEVIASLEEALKIKQNRSGSKP